MASIALQRSKKWLEKLGWHVEIVEKWIPMVNIRKDAFGLHDLIAIRHDSPGVWGINACEDNGAMTKHVKSYLDGGVRESGKKKGETFPPNPHLSVWLAAGNRFSIFGWGLRSSDGHGSRKVWTLRVMEAYLDGAQPKFKEVVSIEGKA